MLQSEFRNFHLYRKFYLILSPKPFENSVNLLRRGKTQNSMPFLGHSCCLCKHKSKYKRKNNINSLLNNLYSQWETSNLEWIFSENKFILDQKSLTGDVRCYLLKIWYRLSHNISLCVFETNYTRWLKESTNFWKIRFLILWQLSVCTWKKCLLKLIL